VQAEANQGTVAPERREEGLQESAQDAQDCSMPSGLVLTCKIYILLVILTACAVRACARALQDCTYIFHPNLFSCFNGFVQTFTFHIFIPVSFVNSMKGERK